MYSWAYCYCSLIGYDEVEGSMGIYELLITGGGDKIVTKTYETLEKALEAYESLLSIGGLSVDSLRAASFDSSEINKVA